MNLLDHVRNDVRAMGPWAAFAYYIDSFLLRSTRGLVRIVSYHIYSQPVPNESIVRDAGSAVKFERLSRDDPRCEQLPRPLAKINARFDAGSECLAAFSSDRLLGCIWLHQGPYQEDEVDCVFEPLPSARCVWDFDVFVHPSQRLGRLFARLWEYAFSDLRARAIVATVSRVALSNANSIRAHERLGATRLATLVFLRVGKLQVLGSSLRPWVSISVGRWRQPVIRIDTGA
jgi:hypothetical protein